MKIKSYIILFFLISVFHTQAQKTFIDYKPKYKEWNARYILDKIEYTPNNTIFHFRYLASKDPFGAMTLYGVGHIEAWALQNTEKESETFKMLDLKNIRKKGKLIIKDFMVSAKRFHLSKKDVFTCEIHFPRLPRHIKKVHFLEGINSAKDIHHFHCLNVKIKHKDEDLGTEKDLEKRVKDLENRVWGEDTEEKILEMVEFVEIKPAPKKKVVEECKAEVGD